MNKKKPRYKFLASVEGKNFKRDGILCEIYIPDRIIEDILIIFKPDSTSREALYWPFEFSISGIVKGPSDNVVAFIESKKTHKSSGTTENSGTLVAESFVHAKPVDLIMSTPLSEEEKCGESKIIEGTFYLTPSFILAPRKHIEQSYTGEVKVENVINLSFTFPSGDRIEFDKYYKYVEDEERDDEVLTFSELVAKFEYKKENHKNIDFEQIDDFLMLASFADRQRCTCLGWETHSDSKLNEFYRGDMTVPEYNSKHRYNDTLVEYNEFEEFIREAYPRFLSSTNLALLREAIHGVIDRDSTFESDFLTLYSSLETLVHIFRIKKDLEFILEKEEWSTLRAVIEKSIKEFLPGSSNKSARKRMYEKIPELNRVSFSEAYNSFCEHYSVDLDDLWPILDRKGGVSLSDIRNRLVHGNKYHPSQHHALIIAGFHLRWVLERMLLKVLGWPVERSKSSPKQLVAYSEMYNQWSSDRENLGTQG